VTHGISVDVEEYFHAVNLRPAFPETEWPRLPRRAMVGVEKALSILERAKAKATFFVLGWVAEHEPEVVRAIASAGHEIASHGHSHKMAQELGPDAFEADVRRSLELLAPLSPRPVRGFRASTFSVTESTWWALERLARIGLDYDSSVFPVRHDRYGVPDFARTPVALEFGGRTLVELPLLTWRVLGRNLPAAGGGYLRQLPLAFTRAALRAADRAGDPGVFYVHPWELDPGQPRAAPSAIGRLAHLRHYRNLERTAERLERLVGEFSFGPLADLLAKAKPLAPRPAGSAA
jgi:polysaccharide deacetylase family protein (PEP-CTERM system associated)